MLKPSKNFSFEEFKVSSSFPDLAAKVELTEMDKLKIFYLCAIHLQPLRDKVGQVVVWSGKRSAELNKAVGGVNTSDHLYLGESVAVDFTVPGQDLRPIWSGLCLNPRTFGQCIYYTKSNFIHLSLPTQKHQGESWEWEK